MERTKHTGCDMERTIHTGCDMERTLGGRLKLKASTDDFSELLSMAYATGVSRLVPKYFHNRIYIYIYIYIYENSPANKTPSFFRSVSSRSSG